MAKDLTHREQEAQLHLGNVADGHATQDLHPGFQSIVDAMPQLWRRCETLRAADAEAEFVDAFSVLAQTPSLARRSKHWLAPTASIAIHIAGSAIVERCSRAGLVTPTFDNLNQLWKRSGLEMAPVQDYLLAAIDSVESAVELLKPLRIDVLFIVSPNNPSGLSFSRAQIRSIAQACKLLSITLVIDRTFRFFVREFFDDYALLEDIGVSHIVIEDTGKTWSTHEMKNSLIACSRDWIEPIDRVYSEIFLSSSPYTVALHTEFLRRTAAIGLDAALWSQVDARRLRLRRVLEGTSLKVAASAQNSWLSVEWLDCSATGLDDIACEALGKERGVWMLPGREFFWHAPNAPESQHYLRIALLKREEAFVTALRGLQSAFGAPPHAREAKAA